MQLSAEALGLLPITTNKYTNKQIHSLMPVIKQAKTK